MSIFTINKDSSVEEIEDFYNLYVEAFPNLCMHNGKQIIDLSEYLTPTPNKAEFIEDIKYLVNASGLIIYFTHNDDVITSISFIETDNITHCYAIVKFLCGNNKTKEIKIDGKSQGHFMLDYIFITYQNYVILIEPANAELISYYVKYKKPSFPYKGNNMKETYNYLIYGNLSRLNEICFEKIFRSFKIIKRLESELKFTSLDDLYNRTNDLDSLKEKLLQKLIHLVKTDQIERKKFQTLSSLINEINYYDIDEYIITSRTFDTEPIRSSAAASSYGGKKKRCTKRKSYKNIKNIKKINKINKLKKLNKYKKTKKLP
jgi:hypothetical protein